MTTFNRSADVNLDGPDTACGMVWNSAPSFSYLPPVVLSNVSRGVRDTLTQLTGMTVFNSTDSLFQSWLYNNWASWAVFSSVPNAGDTLTYDPISATWTPTPITNPVVYSMRVYNDSASTLEVKRIYKSLTTVRTSTSTATMTAVGIHTLTGSTDANYRVDIDSAGVTTFETATFKWSADGGTTYTAFGVPVASGGTAGRKILVPITLSNGVQVLFSTGTFEAGDYWTFTAIASGNQLAALKVDTTNASGVVGDVELSQRVRIVGGDGAASLFVYPTTIAASYSLFLNSSATVTLLGFKAPADASVIDYFNYFASAHQLTYFGSDGAGADTPYWQVNTGAAADRSFDLYPGLKFNDITTPTTPAAAKAMLYSVSNVPKWLNHAGSEQTLTRVATAETVSANWVFSGTPSFTNFKAAEIQDTNGVARIDIGTTNGQAAGVTGGFSVLQPTAALASSFVANSSFSNTVPGEYLYADKVLTTDATPTTMPNPLTMAASTTTRVYAEIVARRTGGGAGTAEDGAGYSLWSTWKNVAGTATQISSTQVLASHESQAAWNATMVASGATVAVQVTGAASNNVSWNVTYHVYTVGS